MAFCVTLWRDFFLHLSLTWLDINSSKYGISLRHKMKLLLTHEFFKALFSTKLRRKKNGDKSLEFTRQVKRNYLMEHGVRGFLIIMDGNSIIHAQTILNERNLNKDPVKIGIGKVISCLEFCQMTLLIRFEIFVKHDSFKSDHQFFSQNINLHAFQIQSQYISNIVPTGWKFFFHFKEFNKCCCTWRTEESPVAFSIYRYHGGPFELKVSLPFPWIFMSVYGDIVYVVLLDILSAQDTITITSF